MLRPASFKSTLCRFGSVFRDRLRKILKVVDHSYYNLILADHARWSLWYTLVSGRQALLCLLCRGSRIILPSEWARQPYHWQKRRYVIRANPLQNTNDVNKEQLR